MMEQPNKKMISRRKFLVTITGTMLATAVGCQPTTPNNPPPTAYVPGSGPRPTDAPVPTIAKRGLDPQWGKLTFDQTQFTPVEDLYITQYDYNNTPQVEVKDWKLVIDGLVEAPLELTYDQIKALPAVEQIRTLECISNPAGGNLIGNLKMKGTELANILQQVKPKQSATHVKFEAVDGYATAVEVKWLKDAILAYDMNDAPLTSTHGFPLRIMMPGLYGQKNPRWLSRIEFIDYDFIGYWEARGWSNIAAVNTHSIIRSPTNNANVTAGATVILQGVAMAGDRKITKVEVQIDEHDWMPATLKSHDKNEQWGWTQWYVEWDISAAGVYRIGVRATDDTGFVQENEAVGVFGQVAPNGTAAIHRLNLQAQQA